MKTTSFLGKRGECLARQYLSAKGWKILTSNYRYKRGELDIVGLDGEVLVFVEVKYRSTIKYGYPESFVDYAKEQMLLATAQQYVFEQDWHGLIRFDVIAIVGNAVPEHFQDVL
jgi:putative endonuclease